MGQLRDDPWVLRRAIEYLAGGLLGRQRTGAGDLEVTVVRPRSAAEAVDPGWHVGQVGGYDLALLEAHAREQSDDPRETDVCVADPQPTELVLPALSLSDPADDAPGPSDPAEYVVS